MNRTMEQCGGNGRILNLCTSDYHTKGFRAAPELLLRRVACATEADEMAGHESGVHGLRHAPEHRHVAFAHPEEASGHGAQAAAGAQPVQSPCPVYQPRAHWGASVVAAQQAHQVAQRASVGQARAQRESATSGPPDARQRACQGSRRCVGRQCVPCAARAAHGALARHLLR